MSAHARATAAAPVPMRARRKNAAAGAPTRGTAAPILASAGRGYFDVRVHGDAPRRIQRQPDDREKSGERAGANAQDNAKDSAQDGTQDSTHGSTQGSADAAAKPAPAPAAPPQASPATPGGHRAAPTGSAACPDAPGRNLIIVGCTAAPAAAPPAKEKAELPTPNTARFGGDAERARFAQELARCHADRVVDAEIAKRFNADVKAAKARAADEAKTQTDEAVKAAVAGVTGRQEIARATAQAQREARKAAAKKIADAGAAVKKQDAAVVSAELAKAFEQALADDYDNTIKGALARFGGGWRNTMQARLDKARKQITKEQTTPPKVPKGTPPPPAKSAEAIAQAIETAMADVRCEQWQWARQQIEDVAHAWAVGRREQVDFETIGQTAAYLGKFGPTYTPAALVDIPADVQSDKNMPGVAPEMADFLTVLKSDPQTPAFKAGNYSGHGGGGWAGKGFSVDLTLATPHDQRGFWHHDAAGAFLLRLDAAAKALGARWRVLYNDFRVAEDVNAATGSRNVEFMGGSSASGLNWHGPAPLILHFHLDLEIPQKPPPKPAAAQGAAP